MLGHSQNTIDAKGRISIPAKMRVDLGSDFVASRGLGECLTLYPAEEWQKLVDKISQLPEEKREILENFYCYNAATMNLDSQGRILLNADLRAEAGLVDEQEAMIVGRFAKIEIWNVSLYEKHRANVTVENVREISKEFGI